MRARLVLLLLAGALALPGGATPQTVQYAYDAAGRLSVVADPRGDLAVYDYDAVGNLLSIRRLPVGDRPEAVVIALVAPPAGRRGASVSIFGKGFAATPAGNAVTFNGVPASVLTAAPTRLTVSVPSEATSGPVRLVVTQAAAVSPEPFRVLGPLSVTPTTAVLAPGASVRFTAVADDGATGAVRWSVDGVVGGDAARGTITTDGVYAAPASLLGDVRVTATSVDDASIDASAAVSVLASRPIFLLAPPVGAASAPAAGSPRTLTTAASVDLARPPRIDVAATASVAIAPGAAFASAEPVTLRVAPVVTGVTPSSGARGETVRLTLTGVGLEGVTRVELLAGATVDQALTTTEPSVADDGHEATLDVHIAAEAGLGPRVVRVLTPTATSGAAALGDNLFTVR